MAGLSRRRREDPALPQHRRAGRLHRLGRGERPVRPPGLGPDPEGDAGRPAPLERGPLRPRRGVRVGRRRARPRPRVRAGQRRRHGRPRSPTAATTVLCAGWSRAHPPTPSWSTPRSPTRARTAASAGTSSATRSPTPGSAPSAASTPGCPGRATSPRPSSATTRRCGSGSAPSRSRSCCPTPPISPSAARSWPTSTATETDVAFIGGDDYVAVFTDVADLARYCRTAKEHRLVKLEWWSELADEEDDATFAPADGSRYDLRKPSTDGAELVRELAEFCGLDADLDVLDAASIDKDDWTDLVTEIRTCFQQD